MGGGGWRHDPLSSFTPDPDRLCEWAKAAGLEITREIEDTDYGSRTFTTVDPWSVSWTFGTYPGS